MFFKEMVLLLLLGWWIKEVKELTGGSEKEGIEGVEGKTRRRKIGRDKTRGVFKFDFSSTIEKV